MAVVAVLAMVAVSAVVVMDAAQYLMGSLFQTTTLLLVIGLPRDAYLGMVHQQMAAEGACLLQALVLLKESWTV
jgi:hypothetical protein